MSVVQNNPEIALNGISTEVKRNNESAISAESLEKARALSEQIKQVEVNKKTEESAVLTPQQLEKVAQQLQDFVGEMNRGLEFSVDKDSGRDVIKVIDKNNGELVKQFPSEEVLTLVAKLSEMVGGFIDTKV
ncbi:flagellar protein FlaG [Thalassotalea sp. PLHSN55]|uniref:flagellar protein FlaG n=1 Tax=Thalassotalea sp. PLHSN55 TaxID=3435888 RepID=UPI003F868AF9